MKLPKVDRHKFNEDGYLLVKGVLSQRAVEVLRKAAYRTIEQDKTNGTMLLHRYARNHLGCLTNIPEFKNLILNDRVVYIAEQLLGEKPCYFGDSVFEIGIGSRGFHKDTSERKNQAHRDWQENYPILRIAFYLQDHKDHSGGLKIRVGSHNTVKTNVGKAIFIPSEAGDAVVFSLRTSHAGNGIRLKFLPNVSWDHRIEKRLPKFLTLREEEERVSIFLTYGLRSPALERYIDFMKNHEVYQKRMALSTYPEELVKDITTKLDFINVKNGYSYADGTE